MIFDYVCLAIAIGVTIWALRLKRNMKDEIEYLNNDKHRLICELNRLHTCRDTRFRELVRREKDLVQWEKTVEKRKQYCEEYADKLSTETAELKKQWEQIEDLTFNGWKHLCIMEERYGGDVFPPETTLRAVSVVVRHPEPNPKTFIIIKDFWYNKYDNDDYKVARQKAEKLLETIKKC